MKHDDAIRSFATARYLLGEMSNAEREDYEAHFFACAVCSQEIRVGFDFIEQLRNGLCISGLLGRPVSRWYDC